MNILKDILNFWRKVHHTQILTHDYDKANVRTCGQMTESPTSRKLHAFQNETFI